MPRDYPPWYDIPDDPREDVCADIHDAFNDDNYGDKFIPERCNDCYMRQWCEVGRQSYAQLLRKYEEDQYYKQMAEDYEIEKECEREAKYRGYFPCMVTCPECNHEAFEDEVGEDVDFTTDFYMGQEADVLIFNCPNCKKRVRSFRRG